MNPVPIMHKDGKENKKIQFQLIKIITKCACGTPESHP
jgi:hypothetical protein